MSNVLTFHRANEYKLGECKPSRHQPAGVPPHQFYIENEMTVEAAPAEVWRMLTDPEKMGLWDHELADVVPSHGYEGHEEDLKGTWRMLLFKDGGAQKQIVTDSIPGDIFAYTTVKGLKSLTPDPRLTVEMHIALFRLFPEVKADGRTATTVTWLNYFEFSGPLPGKRLAALMEKRDRQFNRNLIYLKWHLEKSLATP